MKVPIYCIDSSDSGILVCALTDPFPNPNLRHTIPNSHRFGQQIANLADPLGVTPQGLVGLGPPRRDEILAETDNRHAVFLFDNQTIGHIMPSYAAFSLSSFRRLTCGMARSPP